MTWPRRWSLSVAVPIAIFIVGAVLVSLLTWRNLTHSLLDLESAELRLARLTGVGSSAAIESALRRGDSSEVRRTVERANVARNLEWAAYLDDQGQVRFASRIELAGNHMDETPLRDIAELVRGSQRSMRGYVGMSHDRQHVLAMFPVFVDARDSGGHGSRVGTFVQRLDIRRQREEVVGAAVAQSAIGGGILLLSCLGLWLFLRRLLISRIDRVHAFAEAFEEQAEVPSIDVAGGDEIARLARRLEQMAGALVERSRLLRESQRMEAVGRLAGGVAHDFNNLLTVITGNVELALADASATERDDDLVVLLRQVEQAAASAALLTKRLLAFSRQGITHDEPVEPARAIAEMAALLDRVIGPDHEVIMDLRPTRCVVVDRGQLEQVVFNLVVNARDAMPDGGGITIGCGPGGDREPHDQICIRVDDHGAGVDPADRERIFEPFFTTKPVGRGTGLGLATVRSIVEDCGGRVEVVDASGGGASFRVYLPTTDAVAAEPEVLLPRPDRLANRGGRVLVCEDDAPVRRVAVEMLRAGGFEVAAAASAPDALEWLERHSGQVEVVVTDVMMPGMDGLELARRIHARWSHVRFVFVSGFTSEVDLGELVAFPGSVFLAKPLSADELVAAVARQRAGELSGAE